LWQDQIRNIITDPAGFENFWESMGQSGAKGFILDMVGSGQEFVIYGIRAKESSGRIKYSEGI
jgi:hypothetical protein